MSKSGLMSGALALCFVLACAAAAAASAASAGEKLPAWLSVNGKGVVKADKTTLEILHFGPGWVYTPQSRFGDATVKRADDAITTAATLFAGRVTTRIEAVDADSFRYTAELAGDEPVATIRLVLAFAAPANVREAFFDGKRVDMPADFDGQLNVPLGQAQGREFVIAQPGGGRLVITGDLKVQVINDRRSGAGGYRVRLFFNPDKGDLTASRFEALFRLERPAPVAAAPIDLSPAATMGFADPVAGDGQGGWTDQGPDNDLGMIQPGALDIGGLVFHIIDPGGNGGKSAVVLGRGLPREASVQLNAPGGHLYLLHAAAWPGGDPLAEIVVAYPDGESETLPVKNNRDVGNWWNPARYANAIPAWLADNAENPVGLHFSQFKLRRADPLRLDLRVVGPGAMWMVVAAGLGERPFPVDALVRDTVIVEGGDWVRYDDTPEVLAGSPMDFSAMLDAPAGKYGRVTVAPDGGFNFENAPDKRVRFVGVNLCFEANFPGRADADRLAERLARMGYNAVRFHHQDGPLLKKDAKHAADLDPEKLDRLDYFFAALKKRGLYITTDVLVNRPMLPGDDVPEAVLSRQADETKALLPLSETARRRWEDFARAWLARVNPHTGLTWAGDPALYVIGAVNEGNLPNRWRRVPAVAELYRRAFPAWMAENRPGENPGPADPGNRRFMEFLYDLQGELTRDQMRFLKEELKAAALVTDVNQHSHVPLALVRDHLDVVDSHGYHDHPSFPGGAWGLPYRFRQRSAIGEFGGDFLSKMPRALFGARLFGKPFGVTEYKLCAPNRFRAEGGPLIGAYAALQGWDSLYHFAWAHNLPVALGTRPVIRGFDIANDPLGQLADRLTLFLFRRGDARTAEPAFAYRVDPDFWNDNESEAYPLAFARLGLIARVGNVVGDATPQGVAVVDRAVAEGRSPLPDAAMEKLRRSMEKDGVAASATGEILLDAPARTLAVATPRTECVVLCKGGLAAKRLTVAGASGPQAVSVSSLSEAPLASAPELIVFHMTNTANRNMRFADDKFLQLEHWGEAPRLLRRERVAVTLRLDGPATPTVRALSLPGRVLGDVPSRFENGVLSFEADPGAFAGGVLVYHIVR